MKLLIIGGFLGSGKTTLIEQFIKHLLSLSTLKKQTKVVVIENEIGDVNIDQQTLQTEGLTIKNIYAGCVCCTLKGEIGNALNTLKEEINPQWVLLELSGVAIPSTVKETAEQLNIKTQCAVIIDAKRWERIKGPLNHLIMGQLEKADFVLINKIDQVALKTIEGIEATLKTESRKIFRTALSMEQIGPKVLKEIFNEH